MKYSTKIRQLLANLLVSRLCNFFFVFLITITFTYAQTPAITSVTPTNPNQVEIIKADSKQGLNGEIDFIIARTPETLKPKNPLLIVTESKLGLIDGSVNQAAAQMIGIRVFNENRHYERTAIYGAVTDGGTWRFLKLDENNFYVDTNKFTTDKLPLLLGVLQEIVSFYKK